MNSILKGIAGIVKKHSPEILLVAGIGTGVAAGVIACKKTLKTPAIKEKKEKAIEEIHKKEESGEITEKEMQKELTKTYITSGMEYAKLYSGAVGLGLVAISCFCGLYGVMNNRVVTLSSTVGALIAEQNRLLTEVEHRYGKEVVDDIRNGNRVVNATIENGDGSVDEKEVVVSNSDDLFSIYFDKTTSCYAQDIREYDSMFLKAQERYANDLLNAKKSLVLREVLDGLGIRMDKMRPELAKAALVCGWLKQKDNTVGQNYVNFNIAEVNRVCDDGITRPAWLLKFNVDGSIYDRI